MVAPSLSLTQFYPTFTGRTLANTIRTDLVTTGFDVSNDGARIAGTATNGNSNYIELLLDNPINATGIIFKVFMQTAYRTQNIRVGLGSGPDIYQLWQTPTDPRIFFRLHDLLIDTRQPPVYPAVGAFNITAVDRIRLNFDAISSTTNANLIRFEGIPYYFDGDTEGVQLIDGDIGNPLSFAALYTALEAYNVFAIASRITPLNTFLGTNSMQFVAPVTMGNAGTTAVSQDPSTLIFSSTPNNANNNNIDNSTNLIESAFRARFSGLTAPDRTFQNLNMPFLWADEGGGNTWTRLVLIGPAIVILGTSNYSGTVLRQQGPVTAGQNVSFNFDDALAILAVYQWSNQSVITGSVFDSPNADHYINIDDSLTLPDGTTPAVTINDGDTLDLTGVSFVQPANVSTIRLNIPGKTIDIIAGDSGLTAGDITVVAGSFNLVAAPASIELTNLAPGSRVFIRNTTDGINLFNLIEPTTTFSNSSDAIGKDLLIRVRNASGVTRYKPFQTTATLSSFGLSLVVNQELDE